MSLAFCNPSPTTPAESQAFALMLCVIRIAAKDRFLTQVDAMLHSGAGGKIQRASPNSRERKSPDPVIGSAGRKMKP